MNLEGVGMFNHFFLSYSCVLQATAPFLHIGALAAVTALSWLIAGQFARTEKASEYPLGISSFTLYRSLLSLCGGQGLVGGRHGGESSQQKPGLAPPGSLPRG